MSDITGTTEAPATPAKRKARTFEEREAALRAELAKIQQAARVKDEKKLSVLDEQLIKLNKQLQDFQAKRAALVQEINEVKTRLAGETSD
jgi:predicted  nucleic acid-binding Zn-ribbon protein